MTRHNSRWLIGALVAPLLSAQAASAAGFLIGAYGYGSEDTLHIVGEIMPGDYEQMIMAIRDHGNLPNEVLLNSSGGDVGAAMQIGTFIRTVAVPVMVPRDYACNSACFLIFAGGANRLAINPIGIHRPYYARDYFAGLSPIQAEEKYKALDREVRGYLSRMDVPEAFIDRMMTIKSTDVVYFGAEEIRDLVGLESPSLAEWQIAKCGEMPAGEADDYHAVSSISMMTRLYEDLAESKDEQRSAEIRAWMAELRPHAEYAKTLSPGYRAYLTEKWDKIVACEQDALREHREIVYSELVR